jgi:hypothetical protein
MKWTMKWLTVLMVWAVLVMAGVVQAVEVDLERLGVEGMAAWGGATHVAVIQDDDLTTATTNTAQTLTMTIASNQAVQVLWAVCTERFVDNATNAFNSLTMIIGDGTDDDLFLESMQLCKYGTEVLVKPGRSWQEGVTVTTTSAAVAGTNFVKSVSIAAQTIGRKIYTVADTVDFKFTGPTSYAVSALDAGEVRVYLKIVDTIGN